MVISIIARQTLGKASKSPPNYTRIYHYIEYNSGLVWFNVQQLPLQMASSVFRKLKTGIAVQSSQHFIPTGCRTNRWQSDPIWVREQTPDKSHAVRRSIPRGKLEGWGM
jgi:hypothetical protein